MVLIYFVVAYQTPMVLQIYLFIVTIMIFCFCFVCKIDEPFAGEYLQQGLVKNTKYVER